MNGCVPSRLSRFARVLPTALVLGSLAVLPACAGKGGPTAPAPKDAPKTPISDKPNTPAEPAPKADTTPQPKTDTVAAAPQPMDSSAVAADFCKRITSAAKAAVTADSSLDEPETVVRKIADSIPVETVQVGLAKNMTCR